VNKDFNTVFLSLGSNQGDRYKSLILAMTLLNCSSVRIISLSSIYETEPWGFKSDTSFLNMVLKAITALEPKALLKTVLNIENTMGRERVPGNYSSRVIDIDILFYQDQVINEEEITVPHPLILQRKFVLEPMCELDPGYIHPVLKHPVSYLLTKCKDTGKIVKWKPKEEINDISF
jgi:2-amino-4-hydroxy-6-hydroxymethyldihydropteridine diphosphokinase